MRPVRVSVPASASTQMAVEPRQRPLVQLGNGPPALRGPLEEVLGSTEMPVSELMALQKGSTVALDRRIGEPVDVVVNGQKIARGEITVLDNDPSRFGVKLTDIITAGKSPR